MLAVAPPAVAPPALLGLTQSAPPPPSTSATFAAASAAVAPSASASAAAGHHAGHPGHPYAAPPQRGYDYLCVDPTYVRGTTADSAAADGGQHGASSRPPTSEAPRRPHTGGAGEAPRAPGTAPIDGADFGEALFRAFRSIDLDGSGSVGKRELYEALRSVGVDGSAHQLLRLFAAADADLNGQLNWTEFRALGHQLPQLAELGRPPPSLQPPLPGSSGARHAERARRIQS